MSLGAIEPDLAYVLRLRHQCADSIGLSVPRRSEFRMKPDRHVHSWRATDKGPGSLPCKGCRRDCQDGAPTSSGLPQDASRVFIQVEVAVEVDQIAPTWLRNVVSSAMPRSAKSA